VSHSLFVWYSLCLFGVTAKSLGLYQYFRLAGAQAFPSSLGVIIILINISFILLQ